MVGGKSIERVQRIAPRQAVPLVLLAGFIIFGALFCVSAILYLRANLTRTVALASENTTDDSSSAPFAINYKIEKMGIALATRSGAAGGFAQFTLTFDCASAASKRVLEINRSLLRDAIYEAAADFRIGQFTNPDNLELFKERILEILKERLGEHTPRDLAFEDWVVQPVD